MTIVTVSLSNKDEQLLLKLMEKWKLEKKATTLRACLKKIAELELEEVSK